MAQVFASTFDSGLVDESPLAQTISSETGSTHSLSTAQYVSSPQSLRVPEFSAVSVPAHASMNFSTGFYFRARVRFVSLTNGYDITIAGQWDHGDAGTWYVGYSHSTTPANAGLFIYIDTGDDGGGAGEYSFWSDPVQLAVDTWYDIVWSFDGSGYSFLVDGSLVSTYASAVSFGASTKRFTLGGDLSFGEPNGLLDGYLDNAELHNTAYDTTPPPAPDLSPVITEEVAVDDGVGNPVGGLAVGTAADTTAVEQVQELLSASLRSLSDTMRMIAITNEIKAIAAALTDTVGAEALADALRGVVIAEQFRVQLLQVPSTVRAVGALEAVRWTDLLAAGVPIGLSDGVGIELVSAAGQSMQVIERLGLADVVAQQLTYGWSVEDSIRLATALGRFFGGDIVDTVATEEALTAPLLAHAVTTEEVALATTTNHAMILRVTAPEGIGVAATDLPQMLYAPTLAEGIEIAAGYIAPDGGLTTWAINTRTGAATEYDNFAFNSFAASGHTYMGASNDGLYELRGDDDAGDAIVARIKSGFMRFAGMKFSTIKGAYIGMRGDGDFVLRVITGTDKTYDYAATAKNMETVRVRMGKGLRAHYFAFELIGDGTDFDLDAIEFIPLVNDRRV